METATVIGSVTFLTVSGGLYGLYRWAEKRWHRRAVVRMLAPAETRRRRKEPATAAAAGTRSLAHLAYRLGLAAAPKNEEELKDLRRYLGYAGYRSGRAPLVYFGIKLGLCLALGGGWLLVHAALGLLGGRNLILAFIPMAAGYYLPGVGLKLRVAARQKRIFRELPDALDLLLVCIEAGLSFDMALNRVSRELAHVAPVLAGEFGHYFLETQSGLPRRRAMDNLARRNGVHSLTSVVNVLQQSARFGTDIGEALRVYIRSLRTERRQTAEEKGAKISTHLTFPMVVLILPALFLVILGPAIINLLGRLKAGF